MDDVSAVSDVAMGVRHFFVDVQFGDESNHGDLHGLNFVYDIVEGF